MLRQSGAPLVFTEYYGQDCQANLALVQETVPVTVIQVRQVIFFFPSPSFKHFIHLIKLLCLAGRETERVPELPKFEVPPDHVGGAGGQVEESPHCVGQHVQGCHC